MNAEEQKPLRFLNPYNFVRYLDPPGGTSVDARLMGKTTPPPHDRYVGCTGRITCELEAVTPVFVSDSEDVAPDKDHHHYGFFKYGGKDAIPATTLRGVVRSVFEAATNSCFSVFGGQRLSYHLDTTRTRWLVPARVERNGDEWHLRLLPGDTPLNVGGPPRGNLYAAWIPLYDTWPSRTARENNGSGYAARQRVSIPKDLRHKDECFALMETVQRPRRRRTGPWDFWNVVALSRDKASLEQRRQQGQLLCKGWLCITNKNIGHKHDERFFFRTDRDDLGPLTVPLPEPVRNDYHDLIADYQERHRDAVREREKQKKDPSRYYGKMLAFSRFILEERCDLEPGDLVYAMLTGAQQNPEVEFVVPVSVPRVSHKNSIRDLLPEHLHPCRAPESRDQPDQPLRLCPACRTFGWVQEKAEDKLQQVAYAGRVRFSHGRLTHDAKTEDEITLAILGAPKPTTTYFYLAKKGGSLPEKVHPVEYNKDGFQLRGRKFYLHQRKGPTEEEYQSPEGKKDRMNRTIRGARSKGTKFEFTVDFRNLAPVELGALLWALEMDGKACHRLGLAKPLGFGSATVRVKELRLMNTRQRYLELAADGGMQVWSGDTDEAALEDAVENHVNKFKKAMEEAYGYSSFHDLENIRDLMAILGREGPDELPIHYPRPPMVDEHTGKWKDKPHPDAMNYEWFVGNNRLAQKRDSRGLPDPKHYCLPLPDDTEGLPLMPREGEARED